MLTHFVGQCHDIQVQNKEFLPVCSYVSFTYFELCPTVPDSHLASVLQIQGHAVFKLVQFCITTLISLIVLMLIHLESTATRL